MLAMAKTSFYCPFCCELIKAHEFVYGSSVCNGTIRRQPGFMEKSGLAVSPRSVPCTEDIRAKNGGSHCHDCSGNLTQRLCPHCGHSLPEAVNKLSDVTIAVIGSRESGLNHYIALLIQRIEQLSRDFGWVLHAQTEETGYIYDEVFYTPLFKQGRTIEKSLRWDFYSPLVYSLEFRKKRRHVTLEFFNLYNADFEHEHETFHRYICNASGIICLMDPLQLPPICNEVKSRDVILPHQATDTGTILDRLNRVIRAGFDMKGKSLKEKSIPIPLAIAFSKIDALKSKDPNYPGKLLFDAEHQIYQDTRHRGHVDKAELETIHSDLENWLADAMQDGILSQSRDYATHKFFGFSALGEPPATTSSLSCPPRPIRVEDPFLWLLAKLGFINIK